MSEPLTHDVLSGRYGDPTFAIRDWSDAVALSLFGETREGYELAIGLRDVIEERVEDQADSLQVEADQLEDSLLAAGVRRMLYNRKQVASIPHHVEEVA